MQDKEPILLEYTKRIVANNFIYVFALLSALTILFHYINAIDVSIKHIDVEFGISVILIIYSAICSTIISSKKRLYNDSFLNSGYIRQKHLVILNIFLILLWLTELSGFVLHRDTYLKLLFLSGFIFELLLIMQICIFSKIRFSIWVIIACTILVFELVLFVLYPKNTVSGMLNMILCISIIWAITNTVIVKNI